MPRFMPNERQAACSAFLPRRERRPDFAGGGEQFGGLGADHRDIFVLGGRRVLRGRELHDFALGDHGGGRRQNLQRLQAADLDHHLERLAEQEIADQHARLVAPQHARGEPAAPQLALVDHVVMQQRRGVHEFDGGGELDMAVAGVAGEPRQRQREHRPQPLAAGIDEVVGHLRDHRHFGTGARQNGALTRSMSAATRSTSGSIEGSCGLSNGTTTATELSPQRTREHRNAMVTRQA